MIKKLDKLVRLAMLIALSAVGAYITLPGPVGTIALDSTPGYLAVLLFGGIDGGIVLLFGHLFSSLKMGFPLGIIHLVIAVLMGLCGYIFYYLKQKYTLLIASIATIFSNGVLILLILIPLLGAGFFVAMVVPLSLGAGVNVLLAGVLYKIIKERIA